MKKGWSAPFSNWAIGAMRAESARNNGPEVAKNIKHTLENPVETYNRVMEGDNTVEFYAIKDMNTGKFFNGSRGQASLTFSGNPNLPPKLYKKGVAKSVITQFKKYRNGAENYDLKLMKVTMILEEIDI